MTYRRLISFLIIAILIQSCGNKPNQSNLNTQPDSSSITPYQYKPDVTNCDPSWSNENTVVNHWLNEPPTLHPSNEYTSNRNFVFAYIHAYLMVVDLHTLQLKPELVKSLPKISSDGLTYDFELKDNIKWDDGSAITVEDVLFTYKANACLLTNNAFAKPYIETLVDVQPIDSKKFKFILSKKYILNEYMATYFPILQKSKYDPDGLLNTYSYKNVIDTSILIADKTSNIMKFSEKYNSPLFGNDVSMISGAGAYQLKSWDRGQTMVLVKKENHWSNSTETQDPLYNKFPDKIIFKTIIDENAAIIETNNQSIDVSTFLSTKALLELEKNKSFTNNYHYGYVPAYNSTYLIMNCKPDGIQHSKLFDDKNVRRAMAYLTPVDDVIKVVYYGKADRLVGPMHSQKTGFNKSLLPIPCDVKMANTLLDQAGWKDTDGDNIRDKIIDGKKTKFEFKIMYPSDSPVAKDIADLVIESMKKAQINPIPDGLPMGELVPKATLHDFDMTFFAFGQSALPDDFEQLWGTQSWTSNGSNLSGFGNANSDALIDSIKTELDIKKRIPMLKRFQEMVYDDQPVIFFLSSTRKIIIHKRFGNAYMYYERPGVMLNNLKLICQPGNSTSNVQ